MLATNKTCSISTDGASTQTMPMSTPIFCLTSLKKELTKEMRNMHPPAITIRLQSVNAPQSVKDRRKVAKMEAATIVRTGTDPMVGVSWNTFRIQHNQQMVVSQMSSGLPLLESFGPARPVNHFK